MIFVVDRNENSVKINNGTIMDDEPPLEIHVSTVCDGMWTDYELTIPKTAEVHRGNVRLQNNGKPFIVRIHNPLTSDKERHETFGRKNV